MSYYPHHRLEKACYYQRHRVLSSPLLAPFHQHLPLETFLRHSLQASFLRHLLLETFLRHLLQASFLQHLLLVSKQVLSLQERQQAPRYCHHQLVLKQVLFPQGQQLIDRPPHELAQEQNWPPAPFHHQKTCPLIQSLQAVKSS